MVARRTTGHSAAATWTLPPHRALRKRCTYHSQAMQHITASNNVVFAWQLVSLSCLFQCNHQLVYLRVCIWYQANMCAMGERPATGV